MLRVLTVGLQILFYGKPEGLKKLLEPSQHGFNTRGSMGIATVTDSHYSNKSWRNKFTKFFSKLPDSLKSIDVKSRSGKQELKDWVMRNVRQVPRTAAEML